VGGGVGVGNLHREEPRPRPLFAVDENNDDVSSRL